MGEIDELLRHRPRLGTLATEAEALRARLAKGRGSGTGGASALTAAELRLLPMLATHLSFPQIAAEMYLSRYTIKAQAISICAEQRVCRASVSMRSGCGVARCGLAALAWCSEARRSSSQA